MKRFVSQKTRLIPIPRATAARIRPQVHRTIAFSLSPVSREEGRFRIDGGLPQQTRSDTTPEVLHTRQEYRQDLARPFRPPVRDGMHHSRGRGGGGPRKSHKGSGSGPDSGDDSRRNVEQRGHTLPASAVLASLPGAHGPLFPRWKSRTQSDFRGEEAPLQSKLHQQPLPAARRRASSV